MRARPLGVAVVTGLLRGVLGGAIIALVAVLFLRTSTDIGWYPVGETVVGVVLVSTSLALGDEVADRQRSMVHRALVRAAAGVLLPFMAFAARFSVLAGPVDRELIVGLGVASGTLGLAHGVATSLRQKAPAQALAVEILVPSLALGLVFFSMARGDLFQAIFNLGAMSFVATFVLVVARMLLLTAHMFVQPLTKRVAALLDPGGEA